MSVTFVSGSTGRLIALAILIAGLGPPGAGLADESQPDAKQHEAQPSDDKKWDITAPLGPTTPLSFDTSEGTWLNVDVSPDGRRVVFDLLGDIYLMPISGASQATRPATRLTKGPAFDIQPCFSPDGAQIAFVSDRDGQSNLWVMGLDGQHLRQVSHEKDRPVNSPAWSPDGRYLFARKHFVKERSLGAGEIWTYFTGGGEGLQVTEKNGWQKDAGEPALSPDGRTLYYSKDVSPGQTFEYNRDPNGTIYAIFARDLLTGQERRVTGPQGGAVAPRPSPDGKLLGFVRRVRERSVLHLRDLRTGEEWPVFTGLDRDMQETWAIHGVYPRYAFTPDSKSVVIWGQGKIWLVDVRSHRAAEIPFVAHVEQTLNQPLRFPHKIHEERFPVRMLRHVTTSPDGKLVAYSALGHIYIKRLPDGAPARLTNDGDSAGLEFSPAFSPDGRTLVYATWSDAGHGRIRITPVTGGGGRDVVSAPGHYIEPAFSPDGKLIVYRQAGPDVIRGPSFAAGPGVYLVGLTGAAPQRVGAHWPASQHEDVRAPRFDSTGKRLYLQQRRDDKTVLLSTLLDGSDEIVHFQSDAAMEIVPSPDDRFVAFAERYHVYAAPFPRTGRTLDLGPEAKALPAVQVSRDAGSYLHWSRDSRRLSWSLGPELLTWDLSRSFPVPPQSKADKADKADKPDKQPEPQRSAIGFAQQADAPTGVVAFVGGKVLTMAGDAVTGREGTSPAVTGREGTSPAVTGREGRSPAVIDRGTVIVQGARITAVGRAEDVAIPGGAMRVDVAGKTIMPGLIDVHAHVSGEDDGILAEANWPLLANLAFGVTTAHDPSNNTATVFTSSEMIRAGQRLGPRLFSTGAPLYGAELPIKAVIESYEDALSALRRLRAVGAFTVKSYNQQRRDARQMIIKAGRELGMMVVPEGGSLLYMDETMILDGHTGIEHSLPVPVLYQDVVTLLARSGVGYTPTLIVAYGGLFGENYWYQHSDVWRNERLLRFTPREVIDQRSRRRLMAPDAEWNHVSIARGAKQVLDAGGMVQLGAHGQLQGLGAHWELWMLHQGGMSPLEALRCGTISGARYLGLDSEIGSLEAGKLADLLVLDRDPLEDIRNSESVSLVMVNGRLYRAATLEEIGGRQRRAPVLYWQRERP